MFDQLEQQRSGLVRVSIRAVVSLVLGALLTFLIPAGLGVVGRYLQDDNYQPYRLVILLVTILNLPAVIYCRVFALPPTLPTSDESLYCWSIGFLFNIPYYAIVIFVIWSMTRWILDLRYERQASRRRFDE